MNTFDNHLQQMKGLNKLELCPVVAAINKKGGVGKTFFSCAMGVVAAYAGLKVLIIETCEQRNTVNMLARDRKVPPEKEGGILELMLKPDEHPAKYIIKSKVDNLFILPARSGMTQYFSKNFQDKFPNGYKSASVGLENLRKAFDLIIIDSPPNDDLLPITVLAACTHYFFIRDSDFNSGDGIVQMQKALTDVFKITGESGDCLGILMNDRSKNQQVCETLIGSIGEPPFNYLNYLIPYSKKPISFAATGGVGGFWLKNAFKGQKVTTPVELAIYDFMHFLFLKTGLLTEDI